MNLILFGYKSCGKTYFARLLSQELGCRSIDTDQKIEELYEKECKQKLTCREIAESVGSEKFRELEARVIADLQIDEPTIISVGGGAVLNEINCENLRLLGKLVYLQAECEVIKQRIFSAGIPAFLDSNDPDASFHKMFDARQPIYDKVSQFRVTLKGKSDRQVLNELKLLIV